MTNFTPIPESSAATPGLWNTRFQELDTVLSNISSNVTSFGIVRSGSTLSFQPADSVILRSLDSGGGVWNVGAFNGSVQAALNAAAVGGGGKVVGSPGATYTVASTLTIGSSVEFDASGTTLSCSTLPALRGAGVHHVTVRGGKWVGSGSTFSAGPDAGMIYFLQGAAPCADIRVMDVDVTLAFNGISAVSVERLHVERCSISSFLFMGLNASRCRDVRLLNNSILSSEQDAGVISYGIQATGVAISGFTQRSMIIAGNTIRGVRSWDGIGTHDCDGLQVIGNDIRDVRRGVDIGHADITNRVTSIVVANNYIEATDTDTWAGSGADHGGVQVVGYSSSTSCGRVVIANNAIHNFGNMTGYVKGGFAGPIVVQDSNQITITGNAVTGVGLTNGQNLAGVFLGASLGNVAITGNVLQGAMGLGGVRASGLSADALTLTGNSIIQTTNTVEGVLFSTSTVGSFYEGGNVTNSTAPFSISASTLLRPTSLATDGTATLPGLAFQSERSLGWYRSGASTVALSYGTLNLNQARLVSARTLAASALTASAGNTNVAANEMVFTIGGASGASLAIHSGGTIWVFNSALSARAT